MSKHWAADLATDRATALRLTPVSRETQERLDLFVDLLLAWQKRTNLIAPSTVSHIWTRHIADSLQLLPLAPAAYVWADFGSGAGFPGLPIACALAEKPGAKVHLIERNGKKVAFLREAIRQAAVPAKVHQMRAEDFANSYAEKIDVVTARALAPLKMLCQQAFPLISRGTIGLFLKGQDVDAELTAAAKYWIMTAATTPSLTGAEGSIVVLRSLEPRQTPPLP